MSDKDGRESGSSLGEILNSTAKVMLAELELNRVSLQHRGEVGGANEEIVMRFLSDRLPTSVGVTTGEVVDRTGRRSGQTDVILYDTTRTSMLFRSPGGGRHAVPAEGVLAVIEVKTRLTATRISQVIEHAQTVKRLVRDAYLPHAIETTYEVYGRRWTAPPIVYSVFAFEGDGLYADVLNSEPHFALPPEGRIDNMVVLDRGVCVSVGVDIFGAGGAGSSPARFSATPTPSSAMCDCPTDDALAVWYGLLMGTVLQFVGGPMLDIGRYLEPELRLTGSHGPKTPAAQALRGVVEGDLSARIGLHKDLLRRFAEGGPMEPGELYDLLTNPHFSVKTDEHPAEAGEVMRRQEEARSMTREEWVERYSGGDTHGD